MLPFPLRRINRLHQTKKSNLLPNISLRCVVLKSSPNSPFSISYFSHWLALSPWLSVYGSIHSSFRHLLYFSLYQATVVIDIVVLSQIWILSQLVQVSGWHWCQLEKSDLLRNLSTEAFLLHCPYKAIIKLYTNRLKYIHIENYANDEQYFMWV